MTNKISYSDGPMEEVRVVEDFLPPPEELAFREETVKITIALSKARGGQASGFVSEDDPKVVG